jgi:transposase-like protein
MDLMGTSTGSRPVNGTRADKHDRDNVDVEVAAKPRRRRFTAEYKLRVLQEADELVKVGRVGELLRREGLYSSHLTSWRRERDQGGLAALSRKRGRKVSADATSSKEVRKLTTEIGRLRRRLAQAEAIIDEQKKLLVSWGSP